MLRGKSQTKQEILAHFAHRAAAAGFALDEYQLHAIRQLAEVAARTVNASTAHAPNVASALASSNKKRRNLYLWGPVGRGKSWLVNEFFAALPLEGKKRWHFHDFFRELHARRREAQDSPSRPAGTSAVDLAIDSLLQDCTLLVLDEFHVHDPGDGQLLARFLRALFSRGIALVTTSNYSPGSLMPNGLFHDLFAPTIALIEKHMQVAGVAGPVDYRSLPSNNDGGRECPRFSDGSVISAGADDLARALDGTGLCMPEPHEAVELRPTTWPLAALRATETELWFDFRQLCETPTATQDYLALVRHRLHWVITAVPSRDEISMNGWQRFSNIVDILYDADIPLTLISEAPLDLSPRESPSAIDIARIASRLGQLKVAAAMN